MSEQTASPEEKSMSRRLIVVLVALGLALGMVTPSTSSQETTDVPMFRGNPARTGLMTGPGPDPTIPIVEQWRFTTSGPSFRFGEATIADGIVYVGCEDGNLYAFNAETGQEAWKRETGGMRSSPTVADGVVYASSWDRHLYALDAETGQEVWTFGTGWGEGYSPAVADGIVYVGSWDGHLYAVDAETGQERWRVNTGGPVGSSPTVVNGVVYIGSNDGNLYAVDASTGGAVWTFETGERRPMNFGAPLESSPAVVHGVVYVGSNDGNLYAVDAKTGLPAWTFETKGHLGSSPAVSDGVVYVGSGDGDLYAIAEASTAEVIATVTANAAATGTAEVEATATAVAQEIAWERYFKAIGTTMAESSGLPPGLDVDGAGPVWTSEFLPITWVRGATYPVSVTGSSDEPWTTLLVLPSKDEADAAYAGFTGGLLRSGWQERDVEGIANNHACLVIVQNGQSQGICYVTRDDVLIVSYSFVSVEAPDAALLNATDLARLMNSAYNEVERPE
jgi:outer membrane protein assembly factor BamB